MAIDILTRAVPLVVHHHDGAGEEVDGPFVLIPYKGMLYIGVTSHNDADPLTVILHDGGGLAWHFHRIES